MPELPEVETVRRGLEPALAGARLAQVDPRRPDLRFPFPDRFAERLEGARVEAVRRRAKYLLLPLDTGETWVTHLGMTGRFLIERGQAAEAPGVFTACRRPAKARWRWAVVKPGPSGSGPMPANHGWAGSSAVGIKPM